MFFSDLKEILELESEVVWLVPDLDQYPWVRVTASSFESRTGISKKELNWIRDYPDRPTVVGYSNICDDAQPEFPESSEPSFKRRLFLVREGDYEAYGYRTVPSEAFITSTIKAGKLGTPAENRVQLATRLPFTLIAQLNNYAEKTDQPKTDVIERALRQYLDTETNALLETEMSIPSRLKQLERRVAALEKGV